MRCIWASGGTEARPVEKPASLGLLRRVTDYVELHLDDDLDLAELAALAGLVPQAEGRIAVTCRSGAMLEADFVADCTGRASMSSPPGTADASIG